MGYYSIIETLVCLTEGRINMGYFDESVYGIDMNMDGKTDWKDDVMIVSMMEEEDRKRPADETDDMDFD
jgi:hypothetical protein